MDLAIPDHEAGCLPPSSDMTTLIPRVNTMAPYVVPAHEFARRFGTTLNRVTLLDGLYRMRRRQREVGIAQGFQWIGGSFLRTDREPPDIDVVTFHFPPPSWTSPEVRQAMIEREVDVFQPQHIMALYRCDARTVEIGHWASLIRWTVYWSTLFSFEKASYHADPRAPRRIGFIQLSLLAPDDDEPMREAIETARARLSGQLPTDTVPAGVLATACVPAGQHPADTVSAGDLPAEGLAAG